MCKTAAKEGCLTAAQVDAAKTIYGPFQNPRTNQEIFPGLEPGSEPGWGSFETQGVFPISNDYFRYVIYHDPNWDFRTFDVSRDVAAAEKLDHANVLKAVDPNLTPFVSHGGKLILYHGWSDNLIAPLIASTTSKASRQSWAGWRKPSNPCACLWFRGAGHCGGGEGATNFDMIGPLSSNGRSMERRPSP